MYGVFLSVCAWMHKCECLCDWAYVLFCMDSLVFLCVFECAYVCFCVHAPWFLSMCVWELLLCVCVYVYVCVCVCVRWLVGSERSQHSWAYYVRAGFTECVQWTVMTWVSVAHILGGPELSIHIITLESEARICSSCCRWDVRAKLLL